MKLFTMMVGCTLFVCILSCPSIPESVRPEQSLVQREKGSLEVSKIRAPADLNEEVREIVRPRCGSCHTSTLSTAKPGALKVFDLGQEHWLSTASPKQLESILSRTKSFPTEERTKLVQLIEQEKTKRASL